MRSVSDSIDQTKISRQTNPPKWPSRIHGLGAKKLRVLIFCSRKERDKAEDLCWSDDELRGVPHELIPVGDPTNSGWVVPKEAVPIMRAKGLKFRVPHILTEADLTPKQCKALKLKRAYLIEFGTAGTNEPIILFVNKPPPRWTWTM